MPYKQPIGIEALRRLLELGLECGVIGSVEERESLAYSWFRYGQTKNLPARIALKCIEEENGAPSGRRWVKERKKIVAMRFKAERLAEEEKSSRSIPYGMEGNPARPSTS